MAAEETKRQRAEEKERLLLEQASSGGGGVVVPQPAVATAAAATAVPTASTVIPLKSMPAKAVARGPDEARALLSQLDTPEGAPPIHTPSLHSFRSHLPHTPSHDIDMM